MTQDALLRSLQNYRKHFPGKQERSREAAASQLLFWAALGMPSTCTASYSFSSEPGGLI